MGDFVGKPLDQLESLPAALLGVVHGQCLLSLSHGFYHSTAG